MIISSLLLKKLKVFPLILVEDIFFNNKKAFAFLLHLRNKFLNPDAYLESSRTSTIRFEPLNVFA